MSQPDARGAAAFDLRAGVEQAAERLRGLVRETPVDAAPTLAGPAAEVRLKLENVQITGSFKLRGALNKLLTLDPQTRAHGVTAASSGNHGAAVAYGGQRLGVGARVFVPESAIDAKVEAIRAWGAEVEKVPGDPVLAERRARAVAHEEGCAYVSPYNDEAVIAGQGTIGEELARQFPELDTVIVSLGGGGLSSGVGGYLKAVVPGVEVVACSPANSPVMRESLAAGEILELESRPTLSDGTAGGVEAGAITFELCRRWIDHHVVVSEAAIAAAMRRVIGRHHLLVEGSAALAVAGYLEERERYAGRRVAIVLCGANVSLATLQRVLAPA